MAAKPTSSMLLFADLHLEERSADVVWQVLQRIPVECEKRRIRHVVFLGDFWHVRHVVAVQLLVRCRDILRSWRPFVDRFDVIPGNHDGFDDAGRNLLEVFGDLPGARVHTEPTWTEHGLMMPWRSGEQALAYLAAPVPAGCDNVLFAHLAARGAMMNNTRADEHGLDVDAFAGKFRQSFYGHYHKHQLIRPNMMYVGSPWQVTYAEAGQPKGFVVWDGKKAEHVAWQIGRRHHKVVVDADNPKPLDLSGAAPGDKLWVSCKGQMAGAMREAVAKAVAASGLEVDRFEVDMQPEEKSARLEVKAGEAVGETAARFVAAQDIDDSFKGMLLETFKRLAS